MLEALAPRRSRAANCINVQLGATGCPPLQREALRQRLRSALDRTGTRLSACHFPARDLSNVTHRRRLFDARLDHTVEFPDSFHASVSPH